MHTIRPENNSLKNNINLLIQPISPKRMKEVLITQSCLTICNPMDCSLPGSSVHGILQARVLEWVAMLPPGDLPNPGMEPPSLTPLVLAGDSLSLVPGRLYACMLCLVAQSCLTLCDSMDHSPSGSSVQGEFLGKNTGVGCHALLQGIFSTQGSNPGFLHCRWIFYHLSHHISLKYWSGFPFPSPGDLLNPRIKSLSPALQAGSLLSEPPGNLFLSQKTKQNKNPMPKTHNEIIITA